VQDNIEQKIAKSQISVVIPVFNSEKYLDSCIQSIVAQTGPGFEIILVNDGSTDSSGSICDSWGKKDSRIRVLHKENGGVSNARKTGVDNSSAEWILFVDSDDIIPEKSLDTLYKYVRDDVDIVIGTMKHTKIKRYYKYNYEEKDTLQYLKSLLKTKIQGGPCAKLIRKSLFNPFVFDIPPNIAVGEDFLTNVRIGQNARRVILLPDIVYCYIWRPNSAISKFRILSSEKNYRIAYDRLVKQSIRENYRKPLRWAIIWHYLCRRYWLLRSLIKERK